MRISLLSQRLRRFRETSAGNVIMFFALGAPVLCLAVAIAIDFTNASIVRSKLNAAADAAALAALTPTMLQEPDSVAHDAALAMFNARAAAIGSLDVADTVVTVDISHTNNNMLMRNVTVTYDAATNTIFSQVLNLATIALHGTASATASTPPNINFYLLLDNSPSMGLAATQNDITKLQSLTQTQDGGNGCAFACHQASTNNADTQGNPCSDGSLPTLPDTSVSPPTANQYCVTTDAQGKPNGITQIDNYTLARQNNVTLRVDELTDGVTQLMQTAQTNQTSGLFATPPKYQFAAYEMDLPYTVGTTNSLVMQLTPNYVAGWSTSKSNFSLMEMYQNNQMCADQTCASPNPNLGDVATNYDVSMSDINNTMPNPGQGTNAVGDTPQEVLFVITDGVEDEQNITRLIQPINGGASTNYCDVIKSRNIKIAVLYTEYLAVTANTFYNQNVAPIQANIAPALQACASNGLFYDAKIGDNLGNALATLFQSVVQSAALSN